MLLWIAMLRSLLAALLLAPFLALPAAAQSARRVALVIGIGGYDHLSQLGNPVADAKAIAAALRKSNFAVTERYDLARADFLDTLETFKAEAQGAAVALVFYAGHGMEVEGRNIVAPRDMEIVCEPKTARRAIELQKLFEAIEGSPNQVVLLDACRNDPFPQCPTRAARAGTGFRGLAPIAAQDSTMLVANATLAGQLAADGAPGSHSPFAKALLDRFSSTPQLYFRDLLDLVSQDVRVATQGAQIPEVATRGGSPRACLADEACAGGGTHIAVGPAFLKPPVVTAPTEYAAGDTFKDCDGCPEMVVVPAGQFDMGAPAAEKGRLATEGPPHKVQIGRSFAVGKFEVTFDEWDACALEGGCGGKRADDKSFDSGWGRGRRPVIFVSWDDAKSYAAWLRQKTGKAYRLLTEAEWEYAARGGTTTAFSTGSELATEQANFDASAKPGLRKASHYRGQSLEVGGFPANPFGLHDVHGNVAEWVEDCWNPSHAGAPADGSPRGGDCGRRVVRGGAWYFEDIYLRSAARLSHPKGARLNVIGFRVARALE